MIKTSELRIGNWVYTTSDSNGLTIRPHEIQIKQIETNQVNYTFECDDLEPIPLTEEWLLNFGFEKAIGSYWLKSGVNGDSFHIRLLENGKARVTIVSLVVATINSVHQIQNIYHALTGDELTLETQPHETTSKRF